MATKKRKNWHLCVITFLCGPFLPVTTLAILFRKLSEIFSIKLISCCHCKYDVKVTHCHIFAVILKVFFVSLVTDETTQRNLGKFRTKQKARNIEEKRVKKKEVSITRTKNHESGLNYELNTFQPAYRT